jgi:hypothetical protein
MWFSSLVVVGDECHHAGCRALPTRVLISRPHTYVSLSNLPSAKSAAYNKTSEGPTTDLTLHHVINIPLFFAKMKIKMRYNNTSKLGRPLSNGHELLIQLGH